MPRSELAQRLTVAAIGIPVILAAIYFGGWALTALLAVVAAGGALELYAMAERRGVRPFRVAGAGAAALYVVIAGGAAADGATVAVPGFWQLTLFLALYLAAGAIWLRGVEGGPLPAAGITLFGALYTGGLLAYAVLLRNLLPEGGAARVGGDVVAATPWVGTALVVFPLALTWFNDTCAYFGGRAWGRRKLIPSVSPGKTIAGGLAGVVGTVAFGAAYAALVFDGWLGLPIGAAAGAAGGLLLSPVAQVGDLVESLYKREAGVKDSGAVFPGHGGLLDRLDALLFTFPVAYWYLGFVLASGGATWP